MEKVEFHVGLNIRNFFIYSKLILNYLRNVKYEEETLLTLFFKNYKQKN